MKRNRKITFSMLIVFILTMVSMVLQANSKYRLNGLCNTIAGIIFGIIAVTIVDKLTKRKNK